MQKTYDRAAEDLGNSVHLEHVNVQIPDQRIAGLFYVVGLGLTRDPFLNVADNNMWVNVGRSQFHLPTGNPQVLRGHTGIVMEGREALLERLAERAQASSTARASTSASTTTMSRRPAPGATASAATSRTRRASAASALGFPYVEFDVPVGTAKGIARFYREMIGDAGRSRERRRHRRAHQGRQEAASAVPRDRQAAARLRRASHPDLRRGFLRPAPAAERARPRQPRGQPVPVPLPRHRRSRLRQAPVHDRARGAQPHPSDVPAPAGQPQSGADRAATIRPATTRCRGRWSRSISTTSRSGRCSDSCSSGGPSRPHGEEARSRRSLQVWVYPTCAKCRSRVTGSAAPPFETRTLCAPQGEAGRGRQRLSSPGSHGLMTAR